MFKGNSKDMGAKTANTNSPDQLNRIVEGTVITGEIKSEGNIRIDGKVIGTVNTKGRVVVGPQGKIEGDVNCSNAELEGTIEGELRVEDLLSLRSSAKILGDLYTSKLAIEPGATFTGTCNMGGVVKEMNRTLKSAKKATELLEEQSA